MVCSIQTSTAQLTYAHEGGRAGRGVAMTEKRGGGGGGVGSRQAKVHPQQADWSSEVESFTRRQTRYLLQLKNTRSVDFGEVAVQSGERSKYHQPDSAQSDFFTSLTFSSFTSSFLDERCTDEAQLDSTCISCKFLTP